MCIPYANGMVIGSGCDQFPIGGECHRLYYIIMALERLSNE